MELLYSLLGNCLIEQCQTNKYLTAALACLLLFSFAVGNFLSTDTLDLLLS